MSHGPKRLCRIGVVEAGMVVYVQRVALPQIPTLQFSQGAQLCGTGLSPTVDTRAVVRDLGSTLPGSLAVSHEADIKEAMYLLFIK